mmetsp:Transcript_19600/g.25348  ORF Transcript_19600/g.25348 Transcript_19600/m.25348 type:complete len:467 (+) Transcript_19600:173-1573(+)
MQNQDHPRIRLFAKLSGISAGPKARKRKSQKKSKKDKGNSSVTDAESDSSDSSDSDSSSSSEDEEERSFKWKSPTMFKFFLHLLVDILSKEKIGAKLGSNEKVLVPRAQVDRAISKNFSHADNMFEVIRELKTKLDEINESVGESVLPASLQGEFLIPIDEALEEIMKYAPQELAGSAKNFSHREISNMLRGIAKRRSFAKKGLDTELTELKELTEMFGEYDTDGDNFLSIDELRALLLDIDDKLEDAESETIIAQTMAKFNEQEHSNTDKISLEDFLELANIHVTTARQNSLKPSLTMHMVSSVSDKSTPKAAPDTLQPEIKVTLSAESSQKASFSDVQSEEASRDPLVDSGAPSEISFPSDLAQNPKLDDLIQNTSRSDAGDGTGKSLDTRKSIRRRKSKLANQGPSVSFSRRRSSLSGPTGPLVRRRSSVQSLASLGNLSFKNNIRRSSTKDEEVYFKDSPHI